MRPIKFRGKRKDNGEWAYGSLVVFEDSYFIMPQPPEDWHFLGTTFDYLSVSIIPETVGQYTLLQDAIQKDIFEDDLLKEKDGTTWRVRWWRGSFWFTNIEDEGNLNTYDWLISNKIHGTNFWEDGQYKIIGNIHDSPNLINK